jgi:hypothetical protein
MATLFPSRHQFASAGTANQLGGEQNQVAGNATPGGAAGGPGASPLSGGVVPGQSGSGPVAEPTADTTHCVKGREWDPAIAYWAPPCTAGTIGARYPNNGGATSMGVTADTITLVDYDDGAGPLTDDQIKAVDRAWETFINTHYVLYGRKVKIITWQAKADQFNSQSLLAEMDQIVATDHPFGFYWSTTLCKECYAELASKGVVTIGSRGSSDALANELAPYFYSAQESSTRIETAFAQWWCSQMSSANAPGRTVKWAGHQNPAQNFNGRPRVLGIITPNPPDNQDTVRNYLVPLLQKLCGENVNHYYFYAQDVSTAAQQVAAGIAAMDTANNPATDVLCLCDITAPTYLFSGEQANNYWPENLIADSTGMGWDASARGTYEDKHGQPSQGCATPGQGCEYDMVMGVMADGPQAGGNASEGFAIFHAGGGQDPAPPYPMDVTNDAFNFTMLANLIENCGPMLTPANMQARAPLMPAVGGGASGRPLLQFARGDWQWTQDARIVYWDKYAPSTYDSPPEFGTMVQVGPRYSLSGYPAAVDGPPVPTTGRTGPGK